jgi:aminopeptidase
MDPRTTLLAELLVNYSCGVKKGEKLLVEVNGFEPLGLVDELVRLATRKGAFVFYEFRHDTLLRTLLHHADEAQIKAQAKYPLHQMKDMDCYIGVRGAPNIAELADVPSGQNRLYSLHYRQPVHMKVRVPHTRWVVLRWPNASMAQSARMPQAVFEDFFYNVCTLDYGKMSRAMNPLKKLFDATDEVRIKAPGTDLRFSIKGLPGIKCDGKMNIPDGELFTAPVRDSLEGTVLFNAGSLQDGLVYGDIHLTFRKGKVVKAESGAETKKLNEVLDRDPGSRYVGEFALGFNPYVTRTMLDILFDEKIAGSFHMALGNAYDECDNGNKSSLHWDLIQIQTPEKGGGEIWFDGKLVRRNGLFVPKSLQGLNPANLK